MTNTNDIVRGNTEAVRIDIESRRKQRAAAELVRKQREAAAYQRALDYYNKPSVMDYIKAPFRMVRSLFKMESK